MEGCTQKGTVDDGTLIVDTEKETRQLYTVHTTVDR